MKFAGHICWDANDLQWVAPIDAAAVASDDAIFSPPIIPSPFDEAPTRRRPTARVDEAALLAEFKRPVGNDPHVVVISGATEPVEPLGQMATRKLTIRSGMWSTSRSETRAFDG